MYGKIVKFNGYECFIFCSPNTSKEILTNQLKKKIEKIEKIGFISLN